MNDQGLLANPSSPTMVTAPAGERGELTGLLVAARLWATRRPIDRQRVRRALETILLRAHDRYVKLVPTYRRLAVELGHRRVHDVETLSRDLLVGAAYFKSYDDTLIPQQDFATLTAWLRDISTLDCYPDLTGVTDLEGWRRALPHSGSRTMAAQTSSGRHTHGERRCKRCFAGYCRQRPDGRRDGMRSTWVPGSSTPARSSRPILTWAVIARWLSCL
jgi:hypothetical protein